MMVLYLVESGALGQVTRLLRSLHEETMIKNAWMEKHGFQTSLNLADGSGPPVTDSLGRCMVPWAYFGSTIRW